MVSNIKGFATKDRWTDNWTDMLHSSNLHCMDQNNYRLETEYTDLYVNGVD